MMSYRIKIWKKSAFPSLFFLIAAAYLFGSAFYLKRQVRSEQKQSFGVTASINREEDLQALLAIVSGMVCDGAKASCAAKIASSVDAGILGYNMYLRGQQFYAGDGIVTKGVEATIQNIGRLGKDGMKETNEEIIKMMISD